MNLPDDLARRKATMDAQGGAEAFPYDPKLDPRMIAHAKGLDRLCYLADRTAAKWLYELYWGAEANGRDPKLLAQRRRTEMQKRQEEVEWLSNVAKSCLNGAFGNFIRKEAEKLLLDANGQMYDDEATLRDWVSTVAALDWRSNADATKRTTR